jgi:uncharacterized protein (DUF488 family)
MYYRRKVILSILSEFGGRLPKTTLQKLLFIHSRLQNIKTYDFVPYSFGCYSFTANQDLLTLKKYGIVEELTHQSTQFWVKSDKIDYTVSLSIQDFECLKILKRDFSLFNQEELIKYTYLNYPYFAINSKIAEKVLDSKEHERINVQRHIIKKEIPVIFSIGYEGKSLESFLNQLIINNIKVLIDVRKNALSKKFGFSKSQINLACSSLNIKYIHLPELGINSENRKDLKSHEDYLSLFKEYETNTLPFSEKSLSEILTNFQQNKRIALMCFEADVKMCHRGRVINSLRQLVQKGVPFRNL